MKKWPEEAVEWLRKNVPGRTTKEVVGLMKKQEFEKYGIDITTETIKSAKGRYKIRSGTKGGIKKGTSLIYPEEMEEYIKSIAKGRTTKEIAEMTRNRFKINFSERQCRAYKENHGITSGLDKRFKKGQEPHNKGKPMSESQYEKCKATMFKNGNTPKNHMKIGEFTHTTDGYLIQKVKEKGTQRERFDFVHRKVWEEQNGPIPKGKQITFLDGNKDNCDISNLIMIDNETNLEMNRKKLRFNKPEATRAGVTIAQINIMTKKRRRERGRNQEQHL